MPLPENVLRDITKGLFPMSLKYHAVVFCISIPLSECASYSSVPLKCSASSSAGEMNARALTEALLL